jgi:hypothetical protein
LRFCDCRGSGGFVVIGIQLAPIPELITAEGTVVEGKSKKAKQAPQRVAAGAVDFIPPAAYPQLPVVATRALTPALEDSEKGPVKARIGPTMTAVERGPCDDPEQDAPAAARGLSSTFATNRHLVFDE